MVHTSMACHSPPVCSQGFSGRSWKCKYRNDLPESTISMLPNPPSTIIRRGGAPILVGGIGTSMDRWSRLLAIASDVAGHQSRFMKQLLTVYYQQHHHSGGPKNHHLPSLIITCNDCSNKSPLGKQVLVGCRLLVVRYC